MSTTSIEPEEALDEPTFTSNRPLDYVPGILLLIAVGLLGKYAQIWWNRHPVTQSAVTPSHAAQLTGS
jgi:hypothetical protein